MDWEIKINNILASYGDRKILDGLSAIFKSGTIHAVLGKSGEGKSTLARVILGLLPAEKGSIYIEDKNIFELKKKEFNTLRQSFGVLFQDGALLSSINLWKNIALPLTENAKLSSMEIKKRALQMLDRVELRDYADYYPDELSGGMRKRAGLARALINNPVLLICDEPTSGLDPITARKMDTLLLSLLHFHPHTCIILITHDLKSVKNIADKVLFIDKGKNLFCGSKKEFYANTNALIQEFIENNKETR